MPYRRFEIEADDVEGHAAKRGIEVERMKLQTTDGQEITLEPEGEEGDRWQVVSGPADLQGHYRMR